MRLPALSALSIVAVVLQAVPVAAQVIVPPPTEPVAVDRALFDAGLPVSLDRIKRALDRTPPADGRPRLLNLTEYVVVVGKAPEISLFGGVDLGGGPFRSMHADMMAATRPSKLDQAIGSDGLGVATLALFQLVPPALRVIAGWFSGDQDDRRPGWVAFTETLVLEPADQSSLAAHTLLFHRLEGQRVSFHTRTSHPPSSGFVLAVDSQEWGILEQEVADRTIPNELLQPGRVGNLHSLTVSQVPGTVMEVPLAVDLLVVVHERLEP